MLIFDKVYNFLENDFLIEFLDTIPFFKKLFYKIFLFNIFFTKSEKSAEKILLIPWLIYISIFLFEVFVKNEIFLTFYFFALYFLVNKIYYFSLYISMLKGYQLKAFCFDKYFPVLLDDSLVKTFYVKNVIFIDNLLFANMKNNKNIVKYLWEANEQISFLYFKSSLFFSIKTSLYPKINNFISNVNFCFYFIAFSWLISFWLSEALVTLIFSFFFLCNIYLIFWFFTTKHSLQAILEESIFYSKKWTLKTKSLFLKKGIVLRKFTFNKFSIEEFYLFEILKNKLLKQTVKMLKFKNSLEIAILEEDITKIINDLGLSSLKENEFLLVMEEVKSLQDWFHAKFEEGNIDPLTFEYDFKQEEDKKK